MKSTSHSQVEGKEIWCVCTVSVHCLYHYSVSTEDTDFKEECTSYKEEKVCSVLCWYAVFSLCVYTQSISPQQNKQPLPEYMTPADAVKLYKQVTTNTTALTCIVQLIRNCVWCTRKILCYIIVAIDYCHLYHSSHLHNFIKGNRTSEVP